MINKLLPASFDNNTRFHPSALWIFYLITVMTMGRSLAHIFLADGGAQSIATIPLDQFTASGAASVVSLFALWGLSQILLGLLFVLVAFRYRSMIPLMFVLILLEYSGRVAIGILKPLETVATPPGATGNLVLIVLGIIGLALTLRNPGPDQYKA